MKQKPIGICVRMNVEDFHVMDEMRKIVHLLRTYELFARIQSKSTSYARRKCFSKK